MTCSWLHTHFQQPIKLGKYPVIIHLAHAASFAWELCMSGVQQHTTFGRQAMHATTNDAMRARRACTKHVP